jgi:hypothetical protein
MGVSGYAGFQSEAEQYCTPRLKWGWRSARVGFRRLADLDVPCRGETCFKMARELIWLENSTFAAWGCTGCAWIISNPEPAVSGKPPATVKETFDKHECAKFPRKPLPREQ